MNKLANPYIAAALALLVGVGLGLSLVWRSAVVALEHAVSLVPHHDALPVEARERGWNFWTIEIENLATELKGSAISSISAQSNSRNAKLSWRPSAKNLTKCGVKSRACALRSRLR